MKIISDNQLLSTKLLRFDWGLMGLDTTYTEEVVVEDGRRKFMARVENHSKPAG